MQLNRGILIQQLDGSQFKRLNMHVYASRVNNIVCLHFGHYNGGLTLDKLPRQFCPISELSFYMPALVDETKLDANVIITVDGKVKIFKRIVRGELIEPWSVTYLADDPFN